FPNYQCNATPLFQSGTTLSCHGKCDLILTPTLSILDIDEVKSVPYTPRSHPFVERLIGTIRQEFLDHTLFWNAVDLKRKLALFENYYNHSRTHASLDGNTPAEISGDSVAQPAPLNSYAWEKHCGGLFQLPVAA
ncbi:MAG: integrase core domain-containing protein, partial [Thiogranum sp.]